MEIFIFKAVNIFAWESGASALLKLSWGFPLLGLPGRYSPLPGSPSPRAGVASAVGFPVSGICRLVATGAMTAGHPLSDTCRKMSAVPVNAYLGVCRSLLWQRMRNCLARYLNAYT